MRRASCGAVFAATVAVAALAVSAAPSGSGAAPVSPGAAKGPPPCNYFYMWTGKVRYPVQTDPHDGPAFVALSGDAAKDGIGFLVRGQFVHAAWTSWLTYGEKGNAFSGANFVNNPPKNDYHPARPDPGSIDPFRVGQPMLGTPRNFTLLFKRKGYAWSDIASSLDGTAKADIHRKTNVKPYPRAGKFWVLTNRNYQPLPGYNPGGTRKSTFPVVTAVDLATGSPVDCQKYNVFPDRLQRPPTDPPSKLNYGKVPVRIALKNGSHWNPPGGLGPGPHTEYGPKNPKGLVQFTRPPRAPGADVANVPPPDNCAGYLGTRTSPRRISLVRIPHIANYTKTRGVTSSTTYPNPVKEPWQASYISFGMYGTSSGLYLPGDPDTASIADRQFKVDRTGGSTILIWPRNLSKRQQSRVFDYAKRKGWPIMRGGTSGRQASANILIRIKGAKSDYFGATSKLPCFFDSHKNGHKPWSAIPVQNGSKWVASAKNLGAGAPQGVTCRSIRVLRRGSCLRHLERQIRKTGGRYFAQPPHRGRG